MDIILNIILYALFSATGLIFLKLGTKQNFAIEFDRYACTLQINYLLIIGMFFYIASFLLSLFITPLYNFLKNKITHKTLSHV
jgi:uncharacterized membrane protein